MNILNKVTFQNLKKNKVRTMVTIIGIILSVSMFTAVTSIISSMQHYLIEIAKSTEGSYHCMVSSVNKNKLKVCNNNSDFGGYTSLENVGYAKITSNNEYKPYLFVGGMDENFTEYLPVKITSGEMPKSSGEIILPNHLKENGNNEYKKGDTITLKIGERLLDGVQLKQSDGYADFEKFVTKESKTYKVVGFYERPGFEDYSAPGYTALTISDKSNEYNYDLFFTASKPKEVYDTAKKYFKGFDLNYNNDLLSSYGVSSNENFYTVLYGFAGVLIVIIMLGSISLIYNAFSISVNERTKQFGLLKSIGATKKQVLKSVIFEALFLSIIGIPLGILAGVGGIGITLHFIGGLFAQTLFAEYSVELSLYVSLGAVIIAAAIGLVTVLISAYIPAKRAAKKQAIDSIRQSDDIKIKSNKVKTSKLTYKLFGFPGMIAKKNFKRNNKKYRATVISLTMSIILFLTATTFTAYMTKGSNTVFSYADYDISYSDLIYSSEFDNEKNAINQAESILKNIEGITNYNKITTYQDGELYADKENVTDEYLKEFYLTSSYDKNQAFLSSSIIFVDDDVYRKYLKDQHLSEDIYMNKENPVALVKNEYTYYNADKKKYEVIKIFKNKGASVDCLAFKEINGYYVENATKTTVTYTNETDENETKTYNFKDVSKVYQLKTGEFVEEVPLGLKEQSENIASVFLLPEMCEDTIRSSLFYKDTELYSTFIFKVKDHKSAFKKMTKALEDAELSTGNLFDISEVIEMNAALLLVVNIFTYGFIILISLIAVTNVFNTISTNILLRRREFAMLKSVGMTKKGFNKMMNYECILYGIKSLIYGIPVGIIISLVLGRIMQEGVEIGYILPWKPVLIAIIAVFAVVFITCAYSMRKIKKDSPIEALKNENI